MKKLAILITLCAACSLNATTIPDTGNYWQQDVAYDISVTLDTTRQLLSGTERVLYQNNSPDTLQNVYFHLFPNAFRDETTLRSIEGKQFYRKPPAPPHRSSIEISNFTVSLYGEESSDHQVNGTILRGTLPAGLAPGDSMVMHMQFTHHLRKHYGRAGYEGNQYDFAQWYPKVVVYDNNGWDNDQWHYGGEFYGEFGTFEVTMDVPASFIVAATGQVISGDPGWDEVDVDTSRSYSEWFQSFQGRKAARLDRTGRRTVTFRAERVHDFAWNTSPHFVCEKGAYDNIQVRVFYNDNQGPTWSRTVLAHALNALKWLEQKIGKYPYPQLTVVHGLLGGGMEYPMLVMDGYVDEGLAVHEIGHIYFYGILGNNEMNEAWLDEGFTTFQTRRYLEYHYGEEGRALAELNDDYPGYLVMFPRETAYETDQNRVIDLQLSGNDQPIALPAHEFTSIESYYTNVYTKASLMLGMLEYVMGEQAFWAGLREYYQTWQFKHVNEHRFRTVMESHAETNLDWFFRQWLHSTGYVDYSLQEFTVRPGIGGIYHTTVKIEKHGTYHMPVTVKLSLENGETVRKRWFARRERGVVQFTTSDNPVKVTLDPDNRILDVNYMNNVSGIPRYEYMPDHPAITYYPRDRFVVEWDPKLWYNDIDGGKIGVSFNRHYKGKYRNMGLNLWYGVKSRSFDFDMRYANTLYHLHSRLRYSLRIANMEGRQWNAVSLMKTWERAFELLPKQSVSLGFRNITVSEHRYTVYDWSDGRNNQVVGEYQLDFRGVEWKGSFTLNAITTILGDWSDFSFQKFSAEAIYEYQPDIWSLNLRFYGAGALPGTRLPPQEKYSVSDGGQYAYFQHLYTRSQGSIFGLRNGHDYLYIPGGGNVRGYHASSVPDIDHLGALNFELHYQAYHRYTSTAKPTLIAFADAAYAGLNPEYDHTINAYELFADAGVGIRMHGELFHIPYTFRIDIPFWVNEPGYLGDDASRVDSRFLLSFEGIF